MLTTSVIGFMIILLLPNNQNNEGIVRFQSNLFNNTTCFGKNIKPTWTKTYVSGREFNYKFNIIIIQKNGTKQYRVLSV